MSKTVIIEADNPLSFEELCQALGAEQTLIIKFIEFDLIQPQGKSTDDWRFDTIAFRRAKTAVSFYHDLEVNLNGIALALDLLEKLEKLEHELQHLKHS